MATQILFRMACPSCDAKVPIRDTALVGKKVACPNCKYVFKVENPDGFEAVEPQPKGKKVPAMTKDAAPKKARVHAKLDVKKMGIAVGGVAVAVLGLAGYLLFFNGEPEKPAPRPAVAAINTPPAVATPDVPTPETKTADATPPVDVTKPADTPAAPPPANKAAPATAAPLNPGQVPPSILAIPPQTAGTSAADITNLLPNDVQNVISVNVDKLRFSKLGEQAFESKIGFRPGIFKDKLGIDISDMLRFVRGENVEGKWSFNVIRTSKPVKIQDVARATGFKNAKEVRGRHCFELPANELMDNLALVLVSDGELIQTRKKKDDDASPLCLTQLDETTVVIATTEAMMEFLNSGAKPKQLSRPTTGSADGNNSTEGGGTASALPQPPKGPMSVLTPEFFQAPGGDNVQLSERATYLTIDPALKAMFDRLDEDNKNSAIATQAFLAQSDPRLIARLRGAIWLPPFPGMRVVGLELTRYELEKCYGTIGVEFFNENDVKELEAVLKKAMPDIGKALSAYLGGIKIETDGAGSSGGSSPPGGGPAGNSSGGGTGGTASSGEGSAPPPGAGSGGLPGAEPIPDGPTSRLKLARRARYLFADAQMDVPTRAYDRIAALSEAMVAKARGMVDMSSTTPLWEEFSKSLGKLHDGDKGSMPRATYSRDDNTGGRLARNWPPNHRVSWMAGLLPFLGHDELFRSIERSKTWRDERNLKAGSVLITAFLDPRYPHASWYANLDSLGAHVQGATHYVGIAGVGLDAADYKSDDPTTAKKMGVFNYDRQTAMKDVTDGLSTTICTIQVPPSYQRPWIAGGGATTVGVPETKSVKGFVHNHGNGKKGTYVVMLDGSVRFISENISDDVFKALCTIKGGETVDEIETIAPKVKPGKGGEMKTTPKDDDE